ncbi:MAG: hypothetical protein NC453_17050 [Muribaculum sp.]|nr:hypothetical protein [Muribaculum sp.]
MDLIRSTLNALMNSFPIEMIGKYVCDADSVDLIDVLSEILKWDNKSFTKSEMNLLAKVIQDDWCHSDPLRLTADQPFIERFPLLLTRFSEQVLSRSGMGYPIVQFNHLLRWRLLSLAVDEDLLTIPFIAAKDVTKHTELKRFLWPTILEHDNFRLNSILDTELSDTHSHINAASDIFIFNWLRLMNIPDNPALVVGNDPQNGRKDQTDRSDFFMRDGARKVYDIVSRHNHLHRTLIEWAIIAAAIRLYLYSLATDMPCDITRDTIKEMIVYQDKTFDNLGKINASISQFMESALDTENWIHIDYAIDKKTIS